MELKYYLRGLGLGIVVTALIMGFSLSGKQPMTDDEIIARAKQLGMIEDTVLTADASKEEDNIEVITNEQPATDSEDISRVEEIKEQADSVGQPSEEEATEAADAKTDTKTTEATEAADAKTDTKTTEAIEATDSKKDTKPTEATDDKKDTTAAEVTETTDAATPDASENTVDEEKVTSGASTTITISSGDGSYTVSKKLADVGAVSSAESYDRFLCQNGYDKKIRTGTYVIPADASDEQMARIITGAE